MAFPAQADPVFLSEALERLLPHHDNNAHKVASWLDARHRDGELQLLAGKAEVAPGANPSMLGVKAYIPQTGKAVLYIQVRKALDGDYPIWDDKDVERQRKHQEFWSYGRTTFERVFPTPAKKHGGGRPAVFNNEDLLIEALVYAGVAGALPQQVEGDGSLFEKLTLRLRKRCPERTRFHEIFDPVYRRIKEERDATSKKSKTD
jgi:hypothetical protein